MSPRASPSSPARGTCGIAHRSSCSGGQTAVASCTVTSWLVKCLLTSLAHVCSWAVGFLITGLSLFSVPSGCKPVVGWVDRRCPYRSTPCRFNFLMVSSWSSRTVRKHTETSFSVAFTSRFRYGSGGRRFPTPFLPPAPVGLSLSIPWCRYHSGFPPLLAVSSVWSPVLGSF